MTRAEFETSFVRELASLYPKGHAELTPGQLAELYRALCFLPLADAVDGLRRAWQASPRFLPPAAKIIEAARAARPATKGEHAAEAPADFWRRWWGRQRPELRDRLAAMADAEIEAARLRADYALYAAQRGADALATKAAFAAWQNHLGRLHGKRGQWPPPHKWGPAQEVRYADFAAAFAGAAPVPF